VFRRRRTADDEPDDAFTGDADSAGELDEQSDEGTAAAPAPTLGPWDAADVPDDDLARVDLGALQVPVDEGLEMRVDVQDQTVVAVTIVDGNSSMQVHAFAAPRSAGIWTEVRDEIAQSLREGGGQAEAAEGPFGAELRARVPAPQENAPPGQPPVLQPMRFLGVDGPRWFLRGLLTGPAATDPVQAGRLLDAFRGTVVVRGGDAMAPRDMLPLRLPKDALAVGPDAEEPTRPGLEMLERGPEITETQ
jgi:hypothetical protein